MRVYAVAADQRTPFAPDLPTGAEQGFPGFNIDIRYGMLAPAGTPREIVDKLNAAVNAIVKKPEVQTSLGTSILAPGGVTLGQCAEKIRADIDRYGAVIKKAGIRIE